MKKLCILFALLSFQTHAQEISSGSYGELKLAYNRWMNLITGYYENATGWDDETKKPRFSCIFYFEGTVENNKAEIKSYYPLDKSNVINGHFQAPDSTTIQLKLSEEHGGCGNVQHFADEFVNFKLDKKEDWIYIKYAIKEKAYFHSASNDASIQKTYIVNGDIVYVDQIENTWAHCTYFGKKKIRGWVRVEDLN